MIDETTLALLIGVVVGWAAAGLREWLRDWRNRRQMAQFRVPRDVIVDSLTTDPDDDANCPGCEQPDHLCRLNPYCSWGFSDESRDGGPHG